MRSHSIKLNCVLALVLAGAFLARAASAAFVPNLTYTTPSGWSSPLVVATTPGQTVDSSTLPPFPNDRTLYVSLALTNNGNGAAGAFVVQLLVDGTVVQTANVPGLSVNTNFTIPDLQVSQITATGDHTFQVNINPTHTVTETNYSDNAYTRTVTISTSLPNLTYVTPAGWSGPLVVATSTGSTQDSTSTPPYPTDAVLYAEMAIVNNGTQDAGPFDLVLQLDSVEVQRFHAPGLAQGAQYTQTDINLGSQARGTHSLSMLIDPGNAVVEYTKSDNTFIRTIQALYPMPTFTSGTVSDATCGTFWSYQILAAPNITSYNAANLPGWMNINTSTGLISGTPPLDSAGPQNTTANITVAASDLDFTNSQPVYVTIHPAPPIITSTLSWNAQAGVPMATYTISCAGSPATLNAAPLPAGLSFASPDISGTPTISGTFWVTLTAQNAGGTDTQTLSIGITPGAPAKLAFGQQPGSTGNILAGAGITPAVTVLIQDANGNTVTSNSNVTVAIGTNPGGGTLGGTTTVAAVSGVATFSGLSIDKMGTGYTLVAASSTLTGATSNPFNILGPPAKLAFGQGPGNTVAGASIAPAVTVLVQDANGYTVTNDTSSVTLAIGMNAGGGTLSGTKTVAAVSGVATFSGLSIDKTGTGYTLAATDGTLTSATSNAFNITSGGTVATPTFSPAAGTYSSAQSVTIATTTSGAAIYYTTDGSLPTTSSTKYTGAINVAATTTLKAYAVNAGMSDSTVASAAYTINSAPPAPVITSATTATGTTGVAFTYSITASNSPTSYNAAGLPAGLSVNMSTGAITGTPTAAGNSSVAISATNAGGTGTATLALTIVVPPPVITSATTASGTIGVAFSFQITASNSPASYTATGLPGGLSVDQAKGIISGTPTAALATDVAISAANAGGTGSGTLHLTITGQAAALTSQLTATGTVGQAFTYTITASGATPMTFSAQPLPNGLNLSGATLSGTPTAAGQTSVTIGASNSSGSDNKTLQLTINPAGAPTITSALTATGQAGTAFSYQIKANGDTPLQFFVDSSKLPPGLSFFGDTISGTPTAIGNASLPIQAQNSVGTDTETLVITINAAGAPTITSVLTANSKAGSAFSYTITATGTGTLTFGTNTLPGWLTLSGAALSGSPVGSDVGIYNVTLTAGNSLGTDSKVLQITITPIISDPPVVTDINRSRNPVRTNVNVTFTAGAVSPSGYPLSYSWFFFDPNNAQDGPAQGGQSTTHSFPLEGTYTVVAIAFDGFTKSTNFTKVSVTLAPNQGSNAQSTAQGMQAGNPVNGLNIAVPDSLGGVVNFDVVDSAAVGQASSLSRQAGCLPYKGRAIEPFMTRIAKLPNYNYDGSNLAGKFITQDIFVVETTGQKTGRMARLMVPISGWETGNAPVAADGRKSTGLTSFQLKGKFTFGSKPDTVTLSCTIELPAGLALNQDPPMAISVGIGNVTGSGNVDSKGKVTGLTSPGSNLKKLQVKWPRVDKKKPVTKAGDSATLAITLTGSSLHTAGFDTEGIVNTVATGKKGVARSIQVAIVLGGVSYYAQAKATYVLSKGTGQLTGRAAK